MQAVAFSKLQKSRCFVCAAITTGATDQLRVAWYMNEVCGLKDCNFIVSAGDNFYPAVNISEISQLHGPIASCQRILRVLQHLRCAACLPECIFPVSLHPQSCNLSTASAFETALFLYLSFLGRWSAPRCRFTCRQDADSR